LNLVTKNYVSYVGNPKLMNNTMGGIKIKIPKSLPEQQKIAEVLSLADDEINLLKNELEELKQQKKALIQKLLTGQVRVKV
jgi:type I restriction enzyme, S subunit